MYEVTVTATVTTKVNDKMLFLVEAKQAGIFEIRNIPEEQLQPILGIACPRSSTRTCAPSCPTSARAPASRRCVLSEVNFQAMFEAQQAAARRPGRRRDERLGRRRPGQLSARRRRR